MRLFIKKSRLADYKNDKIRDILIENETIKKIDKDIITPVNTNGQKVFGKAIMTVRKGKIMYQQGEINDSR